MDDAESGWKSDESGWCVGRVEPWPVSEGYAVLAPDDDSRLLEARWQQQARRFFRAELKLLTPKRYPGGGWPREDRAELEVGHRGGERARIAVLTVPLERAPAFREVAAACAVGLGGFAALVARAQRLWQLGPVAPEGEPRATLAAAAIAASILLGPILTPDGEALLGVKSARERLAQCGWDT